MPSTKTTKHLQTVKTKSGKVDKRYATQQFVKADGTKDKRCNKVKKKSCLPSTSPQSQKALPTRCSSRGSRPG